MIVNVAGALELPEGVTELGLREQVRPLRLATVQARDTALLNALTAATLTVDVAEFPGATVAGDGELAEISKSGDVASTIKVSAALREMFPDTPVTVIGYMSGQQLGVKVRMDVPEPPEIVVEESEQVVPLGPRQERVTLPLKPFNGLTTIVDVVALPTVTGVGDNPVAEILKSGWPVGVVFNSTSIPRA